MQDFQMRDRHAREKLTKDNRMARMRRRREMRVVRLIVVNWIAGVAVGAVFASLILWFDLAGIGSLISRAQPVWAPLVLLYGGFGVTFGALVAGTAIMLVPRDEDPPDDPPGGRLIPVRAMARAR